MKIHNLTPFSTERLRVIAQRVIEAELEPETRKGITVHFVPNRSHKNEAYRARRDGFGRRAIDSVPAGLRYNQAIVRMPIQAAVRNPVHYAKQTAMLLAHEFAEMRGLSHESMRNAPGRYFFRGNWDQFYAWAGSLPLELTPRKVKSGPDAKLAHVERMLRLATTREKRAKTIRQKWQRKQSYYVKKLAAMKVSP
jgi:hypothetical protein